MALAIGTVEVIRKGDDLQVTWTGPQEVTIGVGPMSGLEGLESWRATGGEARLPGAARGERRYVQLTGPEGETVIAAERRIPMDGPLNFRDLGGYRTADGRRVRWGRLYRSDSLESLSATDLLLLGRLGIRLVCDLRRDEERERAPSRVVGLDSIAIENLPVGGLAAETRTIAKRMMRGEISELSAESMAAIYIEILDTYPLTWGGVVSRAAEAENLPLVVHCTAGKDRTGVASALLLRAVGVVEADALDDYELSHRYHSRQVIAKVRPLLETKGVEFAKVESYFAASRAVMAATLNGLEDRYGSVEEYLTGPASVDARQLDALRCLLLE